jgi:hypothetical protein
MILCELDKRVSSHILVWSLLVIPHGVVEVEVPYNDMVPAGGLPYCLIKRWQH